MKSIFLFIAAKLICLHVIAQNVGIGTSTPSERLQVNGNVNVTGTIKINGVDGLPNQVMKKNGSGITVWGPVTRTENLTIGSSGFQIHNNQWKYFNGGGELHASETGSDAQFIASVALPNGAQITQLAAYLYDNSTTEGLRVSLYRAAHTGGGFFTVVTASTGVVNSGGYTQIFIPASHTINNLLNSYWVQIEPEDFSWPNPTSTPLRIKGVMISYTYNVN
jgi:hypothetical protein